MIQAGLCKKTEHSVEGHETTDRVIKNKVHDMDPNGEEQNVQMRSIEDMLEQNDNQLDGVINNVPIETEAEKGAKSSVMDKLKATNPEKHCSKCHHPTDREAR